MDILLVLDSFRSLLIVLQPYSFSGTENYWEHSAFELDEVFKVLISKLARNAQGNL